MEKKGLNPGNFKRVEFEIKVKLPVTTEQLEDDADMLIELLTSTVTQLSYPYTSIGKFMKLSETSFRIIFPEKSWEYRIQFYADILKP